MRGLKTLTKSLLCWATCLSFIGMSCSDEPTKSQDEWAWSEVGSAANGQVFALAVWGGQLYAGGTFDSIGSTAAKGIGVWNDSMWSPLEPGIDVTDAYPEPRVNALAVYKDELAVGGYFNQAGGQSAGHLAFWDGTVWSIPASYDGGSVNALTAFDTSLAFGGGLNKPADTCILGIVDNTSWFSLVSGDPYAPGVPPYSGSIHSLTVFNGELVAGGGFLGLDTVTVYGVASFDGNAWSVLGEGLSGGLGVNALTVYDGKLIVAGSFTSAGQNSANNIAAWDGTVWSALGAGLNDEVLALTVYDDKLIAAGWFTAAGGADANHIAAWDGHSWYRLGPGLNASFISALAVYNGDLYAAVNWVLNGTDSTNHIAVWNHR